MNIDNDHADDAIILMTEYLMMTTRMRMTHTENSIDARIVAAVTHCKPVEHEEHDVDVFPAEENMIVTVMIIDIKPILAKITN